MIRSRRSSPPVSASVRRPSPPADSARPKCRELAAWMCDIIDSRGDQVVIDSVKARVLDICARYPVYER